MLSDIFGLENKVSLVTGAGRGLGKEAAIALAEAGSDVALVSRTAADLEAVARQIESLGRRALVLVRGSRGFRPSSRAGRKNGESPWSTRRARQQCLGDRA